MSFAVPCTSMAIRPAQWWTTAWAVHLSALSCQNGYKAFSRKSARGRAWKNIDGRFGCEHVVVRWKTQHCKKERNKRLSTLAGSTSSFHMWVIRMEVITAVSRQESWEKCPRYVLIRVQSQGTFTVMVHSIVLFKYQMMVWNFEANVEKMK